MLETIKSPSDLKTADYDELRTLATEMRQVIVNVVEANGGHLASNLGVVELTLALHRLFESPRDKLVFDISHQTYAHKLLTGRFPSFNTLRKKGGLSGFAEIHESEHDILGAGHAGTGPAYALGTALGTDGYVVCLIGDGGLTSGVAWEGLNNIVNVHPKNLMVVLNDNGMSISPNVGWLVSWRDRWLSQLRSSLEMDADFRRFEESAERLAEKVPFGSVALELLKGAKGTVERAILPPMGAVWEELGFRYLGPVDGHNLAEIEGILTQARGITDKVPFVHVITRKGAGYPPAEQDPARYHQPSSPRGLTYSRVFAETLISCMKKDDRIRALSAAMLDGTELTRVKREFPDRVFDVGIAEQAAVSMAAGMARAGLRPVVCLYSTFFQRAFDQLIHDVALNQLPVVFGIDRAGIVGQDGKTHHGLFDLSFSRLAPGVVVSAAADEAELARLLVTALSHEGPFVIRYPRGEVTGVGVPEVADIQPIEVGTWEKRADYLLPAGEEGADNWVIATGVAVGMAVEASRALAKKGIAAGVVNARFVSPVDREMLRELATAEGQRWPSVPLVVVEENVGAGGLGGAILEALAEMQVPRPVVRLLNAGSDFVPHGTAEELRALVGLTPERIAEVCSEVVK